jgi:hypothetical protein
MENGFMDFIDDIIELRRITKETIPKFEKELQMWRERFLRSVPVHTNNETDASIWLYFTRASPDHMTKNGPEKCLQDIKKIFMRDANEN